ncbi:hypothetical protein OROMI_002770 [Orobanche minor]
MKNRQLLKDGRVWDMYMLMEKGKEVAQFIFTLNDLNSETVTEIKQRVVVDISTDRGCFIDQIHSLDIHFHQPDFQRLGSLHFYAWLKVWLLVRVSVISRGKGKAWEEQGDGEGFKRY